MSSSILQQPVKLLFIHKHQEKGCCETKHQKSARRMRRSGKFMVEVEGRKPEGRGVVLCLVKGFPPYFRLHTEEPARSEIVKERSLQSIRRERLVRSYF